MKRYLINLIIFVILIITIINIPNQVNAVENIINVGDGIKIAEDMPGPVGGAGGGDVISGEINTGSYKPTISNNTRANSMISKIFGALQVFGAVATVISIAMIGINIILGSSDEKAQGKGKAVGILFGAIMIAGISTIAKLILSVVE